jgi:general secretion pathway protein E
MTAEALQHLGLEVGGGAGSLTLHRGRGCVLCRNTGYQGRTGIFEVLPYSDGIRRLTTARTHLDGIRQKGKEEGMMTLRESAIEKMLAGITTYEEVLRVTWE